MQGKERKDGEATHLRLLRQCIWKGNRHRGRRDSVDRPLHHGGEPVAASVEVSADAGVPSAVLAVGAEVEVGVAQADVALVGVHPLDPPPPEVGVQHVVGRRVAVDLDDEVAAVAGMRRELREREAAAVGGVLELE